MLPSCPKPAPLLRRPCRPPVVEVLAGSSRASWSRAPRSGRSPWGSPGTYPPTPSPRPTSQRAPRLVSLPACMIRPPIPVVAAAVAGVSVVCLPHSLGVQEELEGLGLADVALAGEGQQRLLHVVRVEQHAWGPTANTTSRSKDLSLCVCIRGRRLPLQGYGKAQSPPTNACLPAFLRAPTFSRELQVAPQRGRLDDRGLQLDRVARHPRVQVIVLVIGHIS